MSKLKEIRVGGLFKTSDKSKALAALVLSLGLSMWVFVYFITYGTFQFLVEEDFGIFFDYQAISMLDGRFDVPDFAISGEAFVVDGKRFGYFGITPSLLRIPFVLFDLAVGRMSRCLMLVYFVMSLLCSFQILRLSMKTAIDVKAEPPAWAAAAFILAVGLGSTMLFLGSRSFIYHEAILCGIAFSTASSMFALQWLAQPSRQWWAGALVCATLAIHARPSVGLFSLTFVSAIAFWFWLKPFLRKRSVGELSDFASGTPRLQWISPVVILSCCIAVLSINAVGYLKFGSFEVSPLRYHVQIETSPERLAKVADGNFHLENLSFNLAAYLTGKYFELDSHFPYFFSVDPLESERWVDLERIDNAEATVGIPYSMPALFLISITGGVFGLILIPQLRWLLMLTCLSVLPMAFALFTAVAISHRYTGDFVPFLVVTCATGLAALVKTTGRTPVLLILNLAALVCLSILISAALAMEYQGSQIWGVSEDVRENYHLLKRVVDEFFGAS